MLRILTNSWHYRYYRILKKIWYLDDKDAQSLCLYVQTIFWFSLLTFVFAIPLALGWLLLKANRNLYTQLNKKNESTKKCVDFLDDIFRYGRVIERLSNGMDVAPAPALIGSCFLWLASLAAVMSIILFFGWCIWLSVVNFFEIPGVIWWLIISMGHVFFCIFAFIGWLIETVGQYAWALYVLVSSHLNIIGIVLGLAVLGVLIIYGLTKLIMSDMMVGVRQYLVFKYNGFIDARRTAEKRPRPVKEYSVKEEITDEEKIHILDTLTVVWEFLKAIYNGVCPMVDYSETEESQET